MNMQLVEGSVNGDKFEEFVTEALIPILYPFDGTNPRLVVVANGQLFCPSHGYQSSGVFD